METSKVFVLLFLLSTLQFLLVTSIKFEVGGKTGWEVPKSKDAYNQWASQNRFNVNDTVQFNYTKDSVMVVTEEEYEKCHSTKPKFFSNDGHFEFKLDRAGLFYFISGVQGHCQRGQKMIIKVLEPASPPEAATPTKDSQKKRNGAASTMTTMSSSSVTLLLCVVSFLGVKLF